MRIAILTLATGKYIEYLPDLYYTIKKYFLANHDVQIIAFSDGIPPVGITHFPYPKLPWPQSTMTRFTAFLAAQHLYADADVVYYIDADMKIIQPIGDEILPDHDLIGVCHPGFWNGGETFEHNPVSTAFLPDNYNGTYFQGCLFGGKREAFLEMARVLKENIEKDASIGYTARFHDESHQNWYFSKHIVKKLPPSYAFPELWDYAEQNLPKEKKIIHLSKDHSRMRSLEKDKMKIALVGPGIMPIPPIGWGAVEILIWQFHQILQKMGHDVTIYNDRDLESVANHINAGNYDWIHCHYDCDFSFFSQKLSGPFACTSHYGWLPKEDKWEAGYSDIFNATLRCPAIIAHSFKAASIYRKHGYCGQLSYLRNGTNVEDFTFAPVGNGKAICLGKIEPRKRQTELSSALTGKCNIDFAGPQSDPNFTATGTCSYLGTWDKDFVHQHLTDYSCLVLLSDGESAAPLVVMEALSAGLSIVVSEAASANLPAKPYISVIADNEINDNVVSVIRQQIAHNHNQRESIRTFAKEYFDWSVIVEDYLRIAKNFRKAWGQS
jgi:glycosyltransferase involved in cell wall biosynthesis